RDIGFETRKAKTARERDWRHVLRHPSAKLHLYGKAEPRRGRKMGHITCLGPSRDAALASARAVEETLGVAGSGDIGEPPQGRSRRRPSGALTFLGRLGWVALPRRAHGQRGDTRVFRI